MSNTGLNRVLLIGNLGQDPELRFTQSNQGVLTIRMATTESYFDETSKARKELTEWHTVIVWGKRAEALNKILSKGSRIAVEGKNKTRSWEDKKGGGKRYATEVVANNIILLGGRGEGAATGSGQENRSHDAAPGPGYGDSFEQAGGFSTPNDDDIPF